jgi:uncharacterized protein (TIGR02996 family)
MNLRDAFLEDVLARPEDPAVKLVFADWLEDNGRPDLAHAYRRMARRGYRPGQRQRPLARKVWAWWHPRSLELVDPPDRPDVQRCPHAVLPMPIFRALGARRSSGRTPGSGPTPTRPAPWRTTSGGSANLPPWRARDRGGESMGQTPAPLPRGHEKIRPRPCRCLTGSQRGGTRGRIVGGRIESPQGGGPRRAGKFDEDLGCVVRDGRPRPGSGPCARTTPPSSHSVRRQPWAARLAARDVSDSVS